VSVALPKETQFFFEFFYADNIPPGLDARVDGVIDILLVLGSQTGVGATKDAVFSL